MSTSRSLVAAPIGAIPANPAEITFEQLDRLAGVVADAGMFGVKTKQAALALMLMAQAEGRHPMMVAQDYDIVEGKPALKAEKMLARFQASGGKVEWRAMTDKAVIGFFTHPKGSDVEITWTIEDAARIKYFSKGGPNSQGGWKPLAQKHNWQNYPRQMLRARVIGEGVRACYPAAVSVSLTAEEATDPTIHRGDGGDEIGSTGEIVIDAETGEIISEPATATGPQHFQLGAAAEDYVAEFEQRCTAAQNDNDTKLLHEGLEMFRGKISRNRFDYMAEILARTEERVGREMNDASEADYQAFVQESDPALAATIPLDELKGEALYNRLREDGLAIVSMPAPFQIGAFAEWSADLMKVGRLDSLTKDQTADLRKVWANVRADLPNPDEEEPE